MTARLRMDGLVISLGEMDFGRQVTPEAGYCGGTWQAAPEQANGSG